MGDADFQRRCLGKIREVTRGGRTVIVVSHQLETVSNLCDAVLWMESGRVVESGPTAAVVGRYVERERGRSAGRAGATGGPAQVGVTFPAGLQFRPEQPKTFRVAVALTEPPDRPWFVSGLVRDEQNAVVQQFDSRLVGRWYEGRSPVAVDVAIRSPWLKPGTYRVDAYVCVEGQILIEQLGADAFSVLPQLPFDHPADAGAIRHAATLTDFSIADG